MRKRNWADDLLQSVQRKTGRTVSKQSLQKLAGKVTPTTTQSDQQLRQLIQQVAKMAGVQVTEETTRDLIRTIKQNNVSPSNMMSLLKQIQKK
jgi:hypothetical protein